jgi:hypothetical protein
MMHKISSKVLSRLERFEYIYCCNRRIEPFSVAPFVVDCHKLKVLNIDYKSGDSVDLYLTLLVQNCSKYLVHVMLHHVVLSASLLTSIGDCSQMQRLYISSMSMDEKELSGSDFNLLVANKKDLICCVVIIDHLIIRYLNTTNITEGYNDFQYGKAFDFAGPEMNLNSVASMFECVGIQDGQNLKCIQFVFCYKASIVREILERNNVNLVELYCWYVDIGSREIVKFVQDIVGDEVKVVADFNRETDLKKSFWHLL